MERRALLKAAKELAALSLVVTDGAHCGHNRGTYHWELTEAGMALLIDLVKSGAYPCAGHTAAGRAIQAQVQS